MKPRAALAAVAIALAVAGAAWWHADQRAAAPTKRAEAAVSRLLRDPESARWEHIFAADSDPFYACGTVNARNAFGGYAGAHAFLVMDDRAWVFADDVHGATALICCSGTHSERTGYPPDEGWQEACARVTSGQP